MVMSMLAKPPDPLNLEDRTHHGENWKCFKQDWSYYKCEIRVTHLLNVIGKDAQDLYETFTLSDDDRKTLSKFLKSLSHDVSRNQCYL